MRAISKSIHIFASFFSMKKVISLYRVVIYPYCYQFGNSSIESQMPFTDPER